MVMLCFFLYIHVIQKITICWYPFRIFEKFLILAFCCCNAKRRLKILAHLHMYFIFCVVFFHFSFFIFILFVFAFECLFVCYSHEFKLCFSYGFNTCEGRDFLIVCCFWKLYASCSWNWCVNVILWLAISCGAWSIVKHAHEKGMKEVLMLLMAMMWEWLCLCFQCNSIQFNSII